MRKLGLVAPLLAAAFPVLFLYAHNIEKVSFSEADIVLLFILVGSALLTLLLWLLLQDNSAAGFVATVWILIFFLYGHIYKVVKGRAIAGFVVGKHWFLLLLSFVVAVSCLWLVLRNRKVCDHLMPYITAVLSILVGVNLFTISLHHVRTFGTYPGIEESVPSISSPEEMPDIYYIIVDGYASWSTLRDFFNYDNIDFTDWLRNMGFYVASESYANYPTTALSLASSLNMRYLDHFRDTASSRQLIEDHAVWRILKSKGYKFIHFGSLWLLHYNRHANVNVNYFDKALGFLELDMFLRQLFDTTILYAVQKFFFENWMEEHRRRILYQFNELAKVPVQEGPKFVFVHILIPHEPYIFGRNGEPLDPPSYWYDDPTPSPEQVKHLKDRYVDQLIFTNKKLRSVIDSILSTSKRPPIIILQSDHGSANREVSQWGKGLRKGTEMSTETLQLRMRILNAYYLPKSANVDLYLSISPVNSFRIVFNEYFGANFQLLQDRSYFSGSYPWIIDSFIDVTDKVKY